MKKVMIIDDSRTIREQVAAALTPAGFEVVQAEDGQQGLDKITGSSDLALVFCDLNMPRMDGLEMLEQVRRSEKTSLPPIVMLTTEGRTDLVEKAKRAGARGWLVKPFQADHLVAVARKLTGTPVQLSSVHFRDCAGPCARGNVDRREPQPAVSLSHHRGAARDTSAHAGCLVAERSALPALCCPPADHHRSSRLRRWRQAWRARRRGHGGGRAGSDLR